MARYDDSAAYPDQAPGMPARNSHDYMTAPGSAPTPAGSLVSSPPVPQGGPDRAVLVDPYGSTYGATVVPVGPYDTEVGPQAGLYAGSEPNPLSTMPGDWVGHTGAGTGRVTGPGHPNSHGLNGDA
jgi:hypothetical protein